MLASPNAGAIISSSTNIDGSSNCVAVHHTPPICHTRQHSTVLRDRSGVACCTSHGSRVIVLLQQLRSCLTSLLRRGNLHTGRKQQTS